MFPQLKKINNESGIVLFIVLMTAIIIMILSVGILTQSVNEINYAQQQIDQITCDQLTKGMFWNAYSSGALTNNENVQINIENRTYTLTPGSTVNGSSNTWQVNCSYDTFN